MSRSGPWALAGKEKNGPFQNQVLRHLDTPINIEETLKEKKRQDIKWIEKENNKKWQHWPPTYP